MALENSLICFRLSLSITHSVYVSLFVLSVNKQGSTTVSQDRKGPSLFFMMTNPRPSLAAHCRGGPSVAFNYPTVSFFLSFGGDRQPLPHPSFSVLYRGT